MSWGHQSNTHVANGTGIQILVKLTTQSGNVIVQKAIEPYKHEVFGTPNEYITLAVSKPKPGGGWIPSDVMRSLPPDYSFIVEKGQNDFNIFKAKYGKIWVKDEGLQASEPGEVTNAFLKNLAAPLAAIGSLGSFFS